jgi:hypothetical protein
MAHNSIERRRRQYMYRKEISARVEPSRRVVYNPDKYMREPDEILSISAKISSRENRIFKNCPMWKYLKDDDRFGSNVKGMNGMTKEEFEKALEDKEKDDDEKKKERQKDADPSVSEVREALRDIAYFHEKEIEKLFPSVYPLTGPAGKKKGDKAGGGGSGDGGVSGKNTRKRKTDSSAAKVGKRRK